MKISDYKILCSYLKQYCRTVKVPFIDLTVELSNPEDEGVSRNAIRIGGSTNVTDTMARIAGHYVSNIETITGSDPVDSRPEFWNCFAQTLTRWLFHPAVFSESKPESSIAKRLYQNPFMWIMMKDFICPAFQKSPMNLLMVCGSNPYVDIAKYVPVGTIESENAPDEAFIYVNYGIENPAAINSHLLVSVIEAHDLDPHEVVGEIYQSNLYEKLRGILTLANSPEFDAEEFEAILFRLLDMSENDYPHTKEASAGDMQKSSQYMSATGPQVTMPMMWWYLGLTEKMLEPFRGPDWSTRESLQKYIDQFWDDVESKNRQKPQGEGMPFNTMLRMKFEQTVDPINDPRRTIQSLLSNQRILN